MPEKLTARQIDWLLKLVDDEIKRICNERSAPLKTPTPSTLTEYDKAVLRTYNVSWEGDTRL